MGAPSSYCFASDGIGTSVRLDVSKYCSEVREIRKLL